MKQNLFGKRRMTCYFRHISRPSGCQEEVFFDEYLPMSEKIVEMSAFKKVIYAANIIETRKSYKKC
jgi:hypothetical protein